MPEPNPGDGDDDDEDDDEECQETRAEYYASLGTQAPSGGNPAATAYQLSVTGQSYETVIRDSSHSVRVAADGLWMWSDTAVDAKRIQPEHGSPYVMPSETREETSRAAKPPHVP